MISRSDSPALKPLLTVRQVAELLAISQTAVYSLCASGDLPHHKIGVGDKRRRYRFTEDDVAAYLSKTRVEESRIEPLLPQSNRKVTQGHAASSPLEFMRSLGWKG